MLPLQVIHLLQIKEIWTDSKYSHRYLKQMSAADVTEALNGRGPSGNHIIAYSSSINVWSNIRKVEYRYCFFKFSQKCSKTNKFKPTFVTSDSSSDESDSPSMKNLNSHAIQREVDKKLRDLNQSSHSPGNCSSSKLKNEVEVLK